MNRVLRHTLFTLSCIGVAAPASAQVDLAGMWAPIFHEDQVERVPGPDVGEYEGLPINDAARLRAESWDASLLTLPEHQCKPHPSTYGFRGVGTLRITADADEATQRLVKLNTHIEWQEQERQIWMDGRPHPPAYAPHTWQGFSTGRWENGQLIVRTTHLKAGWMRRNGLALSDRTTMTERFFRHGDVLTHVYIIEDPVYLSEPLIRTNGFRLTPNPAMGAYPCLPAVEVPREAGEVPHHLPGKNPFLEEHAKKANAPMTATRGGAATALPEFAKTRAAAPPTPGPRPAALPAPDPAIRSLHVQGNVWMLVGPSANAAVQIGDDGVLVVDTMAAAQSDAMIAEIKRLAGAKPIRWIVNTHADRAHTGGNAAVAEAGEAIVAGNFAAEVGREAANFAQIIAHESVATKLSQPQADGKPLPTAALPTDTFFTPSFELFFNGEAVQVLHQPRAHSDGDAVVFFRKSDVIVAGDIFLTTTFPEFDEGGSINGELASLNRILELTVPRKKQEGGTYVISGHGRLGDEADVVEYRDMLTIIRDRVQDAVKRGQTLQQVKAAGLVRDYEGRYAAASGPASADAFVEALYRQLGGK
jgi:cyclase